MNGAIELSVVVPVYGCAGCLEHLHERLDSALAGVVADFELVLVDDRSTDGGWDVARGLAERDPRVRAFRLSRNFGQHAAISAGVAEARGELIVVMDCDLQDPPEEIPRLLAKAREGNDVVFARRRRPHISPLRRIATRVYYRLIRTFLGITIQGEYGNFSVINRKVRDAVLGIRDKDRHYALILHWLGYQHGEIEYEVAERHAGKSTYSAAKLIAFALSGLFFHTSVLLRWIVYAGLCIAFVGLALAAALVVSFFALADPPEGWTSLAVLTLILSGSILVSVGVTGLYVGRIFTQVKDRPLYVIDERAEGDRAPAPAGTALDAR